MALYRVMAVLTKPDGQTFGDEGYGVTPHEAASAAVFCVAANFKVEPGDRIEIEDTIEIIQTAD